MHFKRLLISILALGLIATACGTSDDTAAPSDGKPKIVVTTNILGDVVSSLVGNSADVTTVMPPGASPHDFQASARQAQTMRQADLLIVNGGGFEEGLLDVISAAEKDGVSVYEAISAVDTLEFGQGQGHSHEGEADHGHPEHGEEDHDHEQSGVDPHFFTDPARMATAAQGIADELRRQVPALDTESFRSGAEKYVGELRRLDSDVAKTLAVIPPRSRILVTNHEVFGYFADRYDFEVVGTVIPGGSTSGAASAGELATLVQVIKAERVPAIFADTSSPDRLAQTLAAEVGDIKVIELYSESLGKPGSGAATYPEMVRTNASRITEALS